ncbi:hypothetical protein CPB86DRAFT_700972 [Serendipita vermifera]|nr:hypothetical protein CPB86DRAFT_700972 [Serendipita vermifera]
MDTLAQRISILSDDDYSIFNSCGQNVSVQKAVLTILESNEHKERKCIGYRLALPLLQQVPYSQTNGRDGKRGAPEKYRCLWHGCDWENKRKLRGLEHIRSHVKNRPFICKICSKGFIRKNELVNHRGCRGPETTSPPILRNIAPQDLGMSRSMNPLTVTTNQEQPSALHLDDSQRTPQNYEPSSSTHTSVDYQQFISSPTALSLSQTDSMQFTPEFETTVASQMAPAYFWRSHLQNTSLTDQSV